MDKRSKILGWLVVVAIVVSVAITFYRTVVLKDFEVTDVTPTTDASSTTP